jgi:hypothetical protein
MQGKGTEKEQQSECDTRFQINLEFLHNQERKLDFPNDNKAKSDAWSVAALLAK